MARRAGYKWKNTEKISMVFVTRKMKPTWHNFSGREKMLMLPKVEWEKPVCGSKLLLGIHQL
jgi:hypothetical protein